MTVPYLDTAAGRLRVHDLITGHDPDLLRATYEQVLVPNFPAAELESLDILSERFGAADGAAFAAVALDSSDQPVAVMIADLFPASRVLLLSYLAVNPQVRSGGVGSALLRGLLPQWREQSGAACVVAEVENPSHHRDTRYGDPTARLRFYRRAGAGLVPVEFLQPRLEPDADRVTGMLLLAFEPAMSVPAQLLREFIVEYVQDAEQVAADTDPVYRSMLAELDRLGLQVPLLDPDRYADVGPLGPT